MSEFWWGFTFGVMATVVLALLVIALYAKGYEDGERDTR